MRFFPMKANLLTAPHTNRPAAAVRDLAFAAPLFVRPSANRVAARARVANSPLGELWTPDLLDRLHAPLTRFHD